MRTSSVCGRVMIGAWIALIGLASTAMAGETVVYSEGFEGNDGSYTLELGTTGEWEWGTPSGSVGPGGAHAGAKCWGTDLDGTLNRPAEGSIISPAITLPAIGPNQLIRARFWAFVAVDGMYDRGQFFVSKDKTSWESLIQLYQNMTSSGTGGSVWQKYEFTLDPSYAGGTIYLRFRAAVQQSSPSFFCGGATDLSGLYVDDVAISVIDNPGSKKVFSMEAWEDASAWASCPWVAPWNGTAFVPDNDIYSVARYPVNEYTDTYKLMRPLVARDGVYPIEVQELESEDSYTDSVALQQVDHAPDVAVAPDNQGRLTSYRPADLLAPLSALTADGTDVADLVRQADGTGYAAYSGDTLVTDFGAADVSQGAVLVLTVKGFVAGEGAERPFVGTPAVVVETADASGAWRESGRLLPRFDASVCAFDLSASLVAGQPVAVRLRSISHSIKYHAIDHLALYAGPAPAFTAATVAPVSATFGDEDILATLAAAGDYFELSSGEKFLVQFPVLPLAAGQVRDFMFVAKGCYWPKSGSYLIYTWDGSSWVLRDSYTYPGVDMIRDFDLSLFLPDPTGDYRVRVWQDYQYEPAGIDCARMTVAGLDAPLNFAWDYRAGASIFGVVANSDNVRTSWSSCPRNRVTEFAFTPPVPANTPPSTCPVTAEDFPVISWTYTDAEGNAQASYEVQIWTGPGQSGSIVWNPPVGSGSETSVTYPGTALPEGTYYVIVRANDGMDWGAWCQTSFEVSGNQAPVAQCRDVTVEAGNGCQAPASVDDGSYDPDGDAITVVQTPPGPYDLGETPVTLTVTDAKGASSQCAATVTVVDTTPPLIVCPPDLTLNNDPGQCSAVGVFVVTASDLCSVSSLTVEPPSGAVFPKGTTVVTATATDTTGNRSQCTFRVVVVDTEPPQLTCPALVAVGCSPQVLAPVVYPPAVVADNCDADPTVTYSPPSGSGFPVGPTTVTCVATDDDGNSTSCTFTVVRAPLGFTGFLPPIGGEVAAGTGGSFADPVRTFKLGSTVPVKFLLTCDGSAVKTGIHTLQAIKFSNAVDSDPAIDASPTDAATTGNQFRLTDPAGAQWHFNLNTKVGMSAGTWKLVATLADNTRHEVWVSIKR